MHENRKRSAERLQHATVEEKISNNKHSSSASIRCVRHQKRNRLLRNLFYRSMDFKYNMIVGMRRENSYTVGKKVDLIPITSIEDERELLKR